MFKTLIVWYNILKILTRTSGQNGEIFMGIVNAIANMSTCMNQAKFQQNLQTKLLDKAMDTSKVQADKLIESMNENIKSFGHIFDVRV